MSGIQNSLVTYCWLWHNAQITSITKLQWPPLQETWQGCRKQDVQCPWQVKNNGGQTKILFFFLLRSICTGAVDWNFTPLCQQFYSFLHSSALTVVLCLYSQICNHVDMLKCLLVVKVYTLHFCGVFACMWWEWNTTVY